MSAPALKPSWSTAPAAEQHQPTRPTTARIPPSISPRTRQIRTAGTARPKTATTLRPTKSAGHVPRFTRIYSASSMQDSMTPGSDLTPSLVTPELIYMAPKSIHAFHEKFWRAIPEMARGGLYDSEALIPGIKYQPKEMPAPPKLGPPPLPKPLFIRINPATTTPLPTPLTNLKYRPGTADSFESFEGYGEPASLESEALHEQPSEITDISCQKAISSQSLSSFGISMGHCLTSSSGFQYYRETSRVSPITIGLFVRRLEKLCREFDVHWAEVNSKAVEKLLTKPILKKITRKQILECLFNRTEVEAIVYDPRNRYTARRLPFLAACRIMETWRTWRLRSNHLDLLKHIRAAEGMRDQYRRRQKQKALMRRFTGRLEENKVVCDALSKKLKASWRQVYKGKKRVVIHIPSISCSLNLRRGMRNIRMQQLQQLGRLTDIQDPNVIVILVYLPIEGDEFLEEQFQMFISGAYDAYKLMNEGRFWIVIPEAYSAFPETAPLSAMLYSSARAMKQIKDLVGDLPAYIQTGIPGDYDIKISAALNIPLMQPYSTVEPMLFSKSLQRELLSESMVQMAPGCSFIKTEEDFLCAARQLILNNSNFYRFIIKMDGEVDSRGIAYFDTKRFTKNWSQKAYWRPLLLMNLCRHCRLVRQDVHGNFQRYLSRFLEQGGIIEGAPPVATYELKETGDAILDADLLSGPPSRSPSVFFMIEPDGTLVLKGSVDKISTSPYNFWGCLAPHQSCEAEELYEAAENVARLCAVRGIFGLISIDFAVWDDLAQEERHIWAVGLKPYYTEPYSLYQLFCLAMNGRVTQPSRAARTSGFDKPFRVMFDANIARRLNLRYLSRIPYVDMEHVKQASGTVGVEETEDPEERFGIISTRFCHPGFKYISPHAVHSICNDTQAVFDPRWKLGALYMPAFQSNRTQLAFMFTSKSAIDAIETVLTTLIVLYRRLLTTYIDQGNNFMEITKALVPELIQSRLRAQLKRALKPPPGEPELFDVTWQRRRSGPQISPVAIEISHAEILEARRRVSLPTKRFSPKMEVHRTSLRPVTAKDLLAAPSMGGSFASISFTSLPDILVSGAVDAIEEDPAEIIYRDREDQDSNKGSEDSDEDNPARFSPMELLLRRVIKLPDFGSLGLSNFNPNQFQHEVRRLQTRRRQPHEGEVPTRPVLSLESSMETMRILNTPIPSLVLRRMDPSFCNIKPLNGPILPEHFNDPARVPTGLPLETYMAIMERRATEKEEEEKLAAKQREMQERKKKEEEERTRKRLEERRKMLEEEEERLKWEDQMRKATEGKSLIEKVAIESELLKKRDEEHRKKVQQEVSEEEAKIKEGRTRDELLAERVENKRNIVSLKDFMDRGQKIKLEGGNSRSPSTMEMNERDSPSSGIVLDVLGRSRPGSPKKGQSDIGGSRPGSPQKKPVLSVFRYLRDEFLGLEHEDT